MANAWASSCRVVLRQTSWVEVEELPQRIVAQSGIPITTGTPKTDNPSGYCYKAGQRRGG